MDYLRSISAVLILICSLILLQGCSHYTILMHAGETPKNHYIIIDNDDWNGNRCYDCYSRPDSVNWKPTCKEVKFIK
jgi:hypothetical protein